MLTLLGESSAGVARGSNRESTIAFSLSYEDHSATRTKPVLFDREEQEEDLVFPVGEAGEREFLVAKACWKGETSMQVSACTQL